MWIRQLTKLFSILFLLNTPAYAEVSAETNRLSVKTCEETAGAICSLKFDNIELVDHEGYLRDHGRQWQSALVVDRQGEDQNPTQAGSSHLIDGYIPSPSSSVLEAEYEHPNGRSFATRTRMAYWKPYEGQILSDYTVTQGVYLDNEFDIKNMVVVDVIFNLPKNSFVQFEVLTGYIKGIGWEFSIYNISTDRFREVSREKEYLFPTLISHPSGYPTIGIYSPHTISSTDPKSGNGLWHYPPPLNVTKWNVVDRVENPDTSNYYRVYILFGGKATVKSNMRKLIEELENEV